MMKNYGRSKISEFLEDQVVYRSLNPLDTRLPALDAIREDVGLPPGVIPRKSEPDYARVIIHLLQEARKLDAPGSKISRILFVGDTRLNDGLAFDNLCQVSGWPGLAFIGSETDAPPKVEIVPTQSGNALYLSNRWGALADFDGYCRESNFPIDATTAIILDLDKTTLGARGRNAHVIDQARVQAVKDTVADLLGASFDPATFQDDYSQLNLVEFHPFTTDNQDYLAYICLILGSGLYDLDTIVEEVNSGRLTSFPQWIAQVDERCNELPSALAEIHSEIYQLVQAGDPTPFKEFRRNEYLATVGRMGHLSDYQPEAAFIKALIQDEIVITQEVRTQALVWKGDGALLFGLSDKPDEASVPTEEQAQKGYQSIHRTATHAVGSA